MARSSLIIATHDEAQRLDTVSGVMGLGEIVSEEGGDAKALYCFDGIFEGTSLPPTANDVLENGSLVLEYLASQGQRQGEGAGVDLYNTFVSALPIPPDPSSTIKKKAAICAPNDTAVNDVAFSFILTDFVIPAINSDVQVHVYDTSEWLAPSTYDETHADRTAGVFCGGLFWDVVSVDDANHLTIKNRGLAGARLTYKS